MVAITLGNGTAKLYVNSTLKATSSGVTIKPSDFQPGSNYQHAYNIEFY
jgi:hypothetical protein